MKLTVQSTGKDRYRLGISSHDSFKYFKCRGLKEVGDNPKKWSRG